jgi:hypothetical protein
MKPKTFVAIVLIARHANRLPGRPLDEQWTGRGLGATRTTAERWYSVPLPPVFGRSRHGGIALLLDRDDFNPAAIDPVGEDPVAAELNR